MLARLLHLLPGLSHCLLDYRIQFLDYRFCFVCLLDYRVCLLDYRFCFISLLDYCICLLDYHCFCFILLARLPRFPFKTIVDTQKHV